MSVAKWTNNARVKQMSRLRDRKFNFHIFARDVLPVKNPSDPPSTMYGEHVDTGDNVDMTYQLYMTAQPSFT